jgi:hypothetical protein
MPRQRVQKKELISLQRYVLFRGLLSLLGSDGHVSWAVVFNPLKNYWLRKGVPIDLPYFAYLAHPHQNLNHVLPSTQFFTTGDYITLVPTFCAVWGLRYVRKIVKSFGSYAEPLLHVYIIRLRLNASNIMSFFPLIRPFGLVYSLAGFLLYLFRCRYFPLLGAAFNAFPDVRKVIEDPRAYHPPAYNWWDSVSFVARHIFHSAMLGVAVAVAPPVNLWTTWRPWYHHLLLVYQAFWSMTMLERAIHHMAQVLSLLWVPIALLVFDDDNILELFKFTLRFWMSAGLSIFGGLIITAASTRSPAEIFVAILIWIALHFHAKLVIFMAEWVCVWFLQIVWPFIASPTIRYIFLTLATPLVAIINLRSLAAIVILWVVVRVYNYLDTLFDDPYGLGKTYRSLSQARVLVRSHISEDRLRRVTQGFTNRRWTSRASGESVSVPLNPATSPSNLTSPPKTSMMGHGFGDASQLMYRKIFPQNPEIASQDSGGLAEEYPNSKETQ